MNRTVERATRKLLYDLQKKKGERAKISQSGAAKLEPVKMPQWIHLFISPEPQLACWPIRQNNDNNSMNCECGLCRTLQCPLRQAHNSLAGFLATASRLSLWRRIILPRSSFDYQEFSYFSDSLVTVWILRMQTRVCVPANSKYRNPNIINNIWHCDNINLTGERIDPMDPNRWIPGKDPFVPQFAIPIR